MHAQAEIAGLRTPSSPVRKREKEGGRERKRKGEREREGEIERKREERERNIDMVIEFISLLLTMVALQIKYSKSKCFSNTLTRNKFFNKALSATRWRYQSQV